MKRLLLSPAQAIILGLAPTAPLLADDLFSDDFEGYTADTLLDTSGPWGTASAAGVLFVRDDLTATPFGPENQYLGWEDTSSTASARAQSPNIGAISGGITTLSFDFNEPASGGDGNFLFGFAKAGQDLNTAGSYLSLRLDDGTIGHAIGSFVITGTTSFALDTSYTIYLVLNDTTTAVTDYYNGRTLSGGTADLWLDTLGSGTPIYVGTVIPGGDHTSSFRASLRSFSSDLQTMQVDNVRLETGIGGPMSTPLPPFLPPSGQPQSQTVVAGTGLIRLTVQPGGEPPFTYQWKHGAADIPGATGQSLWIDTPDASEAGDYTVVVTNAQGNTTSDPATVSLVAATSSLIENFDSYTPDFLENVGSDWTVNLNGYYSVTDDGNGDNYLACLHADTSTTAPVLKPLGTDAIANGDTSTFFSRVYLDGTADGSLWFGLTDMLTGGYNAFEGYVTFGNNGSINPRDGGGGGVSVTASLTADTWHNFWMIHNNASDTVQVFMTTDDRDATLADRLETSAGQVEFAFRNGTGNPLSHVQLINRNTTGPWRVDDFYISPLANLVYPVLPVLGPLSIELQGANAVLTWPGEGVLQNNNNLQGTWSDVNSGTATSPHTVTGPLSGTEFFRLRNQ